MDVKRLRLISFFLCLNLIASAQEYRALILPVQFPDLGFTYGPEEFDSLSDSLTLYFDAQFYGKASFRFETAPVATLPKHYSYYGANSSEGPDFRIAEGIAEACRQVDPEVNFAAYSTDGRNVDKVLVLLPGKSETDTSDVNMFWPRYISLSESGEAPSLDGRRITNAGIFCEKGPEGGFTGIGTAAHEFGHALGLSDFYDTDGEGSGGRSKGLWGSLDLMDGGNRNAGGHLPPNLGAVNLYILGNGTPQTAEGSGHHILEPITESGRYLLVHNPAREEYFTIENRAAEGWDAFMGGSGLLVCHVDRSDTPAGWSDFYKVELNAYERWEKNQVNCNPAYQCVEAVAADTVSVASVFFPYTGHTNLGPETVPPFVFNDGTPSQYSLLNITREGRNVSFDLIRPIVINSIDVFQTTMIVTWKADGAIGPVADNRLLAISGADTVATATCREIADSLFSGTLDGLTPNREYTVKVLALCSDGSRHSALRTVKTHPYRSRVYPFIYLKSRERNADGSFSPGARIPLQVFNAPDAVEIHWYMNDREISAADGAYTLRESGRLKVELFREDGSKEVIVKEITVR